MSHMFICTSNASFPHFPQVKARFVRIHVVSWNNHPSLRLEIIGCQECNKVISQQPFAEFSASSYKKWRSSRIQTCSPDMADIASERGWCPRKHNGTITSISTN